MNKSLLAVSTTYNPRGLRAAKAVARDRGISDVTIWRWGKRGWIKLINISGRPYVDLASMAEFDRRAAWANSPSRLLVQLGEPQTQEQPKRLLRCERSSQSLSQAGAHGEQ